MSTVTTSPCVRRADRSDAADGTRHRNLVDVHASDPLGPGKPVPSRALEKTVADLQRHTGARIFLANRGNFATGVATGFLAFSTFRAVLLLNIHDIAVLRECRGRGIAWARPGPGRSASAGGDVTAPAFFEVRGDNPGLPTVHDTGLRRRKASPVPLRGEAPDTGNSSRHRPGP